MFSNLPLPSTSPPHPGLHLLDHLVILSPNLCLTVLVLYVRFILSTLLLLISLHIISFICGTSSKMHTSKGYTVPLTQNSVLPMMKLARFLQPRRGAAAIRHLPQPTQTSTHIRKSIPVRYIANSVALLLPPPVGREPRYVSARLQTHKPRLIADT